MSNKDLYLKLKSAYSYDNMNKITAGIIEYYKSGEYDILRKIMKIISEYFPFKDTNSGIHKCFYRLIMIYHPDKAVQYRNEIDNIMKNGNLDMLSQYSHILLIQEMDNVIETVDYESEIEYDPQYKWDYENTGFEYFSDNDSEKQEYSQDDYTEGNFNNDFFSAVKRKLYGSMEIDLPPYYLEDMEDIEMAEYEIDSLDGIEYCRYVKNLDLSRNTITDVTGLVNLIHLEELYLADNQIGFIDALYNLKRLRIVDLSNNNIDDISPLLDLENLEYVSITGNMIHEKQIEQLKQKNIIVIY